MPGFIDTHLHVESSLVTPLEFDRCVLPHGVTTAICDPHEIANVLGTAAFDYFLACAERTIMDLRVQLSSCVPATHLETSGAPHRRGGTRCPSATHPKVIGLAEFMNFPGVLARDPACLAKLAAFQDGHIDGHAPLLSGYDLNGYLAAGIRTDHERTTAAEALEKIRKGMTILIREGSVSKDLHALAPLLTIAHVAVPRALHRRPQSARHRRGGPSRLHDPHADRPRLPTARRLSRRIAFPPRSAFGLRDRGMIAPGWRADIVLLDDLETLRGSQMVVAGGRRVDDGAVRQPRHRRAGRPRQRQGAGASRRPISRSRARPARHR